VVGIREFYSIEDAILVSMQAHLFVPISSQWRKVWPTIRWHHVIISEIDSYLSRNGMIVGSGLKYDMESFCALKFSVFL
jgi:hypothetical protein